MIIIAGSLLGIIILAARSRKHLGLLLIRMVYGKYSIEFLSLFKRFFKRSPFQYCFRDEFVSHVLFVLDMKNEIPVYKTFSTVNFEDQPFFTPYKDFLKQRGEPYCFNAFSFDNPHFIIKVVGYQEKISGQKGIASYYFIDDLFFMGEYIFKQNSDKIKKIFLEPFIDVKKVSEDNFYIENTHDRVIHYQDTGFSIDIKYLSREDKQILDLLKTYHDAMTSKTLTVEL